jgi:hypothetical protein
MNERAIRLMLASAAVLSIVACDLEPQPDQRDQTVGYRSGTVNDDYLSSGERGNVSISEVNWAGSVESVGDGFIHHPDDVFIELQNRHNRPTHFTRWLLTVETGVAMDTLHAERNDGNRSWAYILPTRENNRPVEPNEFFVVAARRDGAFQQADYYIEDLHLPDAPFRITLQDLDERLIDSVGDDRKPVFAGAWDGVTSRSMERTQLLFNNRGDRDMAWHSYSLNDFSVEEQATLHERLRSEIAESFRARTFASPGFPSTPDYSGSFSSGDFQ